MMNRRVWLSLIVFAACTGTAAAVQKAMTFEVFPDASGDYRWRMKDADDKLVANSGQGYKAKADCTKMVGNFKADISKYAFEVYEDNAKKFRFRMNAKNGQTVGSSTSGYDTKAEAEKVVAAITKGAKSAKIKDDAK